MISVPVFDILGKTLDPVEVDAGKLGGEVRLALLREAIQMYEMNQHVCTKGALTRGQVRGSTRKMYRQKHTGNARAGGRRVPHRKGGGVAFPPVTRSLTYHMPRKARRLAACSALLSRLQDGEVSLVDKIELEAPKTKTIAGFLRAVDLQGRCLLVCDGDHTVVWKSGRNIEGVTVRRVVDINAYDLMAPDRVVFTRAAFQAALEALGA